MAQDNELRVSAIGIGGLSFFSFGGISVCFVAFNFTGIPTSNDGGLAGALVSPAPSGIERTPQTDSLSDAAQPSETISIPAPPPYDREQPEGVQRSPSQFSHHGHGWHETHSHGPFGKISWEYRCNDCNRLLYRSQRRLVADERTTPR